MSTQLEAIVLKNFDYQDHHKIVKMISPSHGLISVFVSYASRKNSRYRMISEPLTMVTITVKSPREGKDMYQLVHGDVIDGFYDLKIDYEKVMMFYEMATIILKGDLQEAELPYAYRTLVSVLEAGTATEPDYLFRWRVVAFKAKLTVAVGIAPAVDGCVDCGTKSNIVTASATAGGLICEHCYSGDGIWVTTDLITLWRSLFKLPLNDLFELEITESELVVFETWMKSYYEGFTNIKFANRLST
jgi:DNA repair protein RecO (recombination protein O)